MMRISNKICGMRMTVYVMLSEVW